MGPSAARSLSDCPLVDGKEVVFIKPERKICKTLVHTKDVFGSPFKSRKSTGMCASIPAGGVLQAGENQFNGSKKATAKEAKGFK